MTEKLAELIDFHQGDLKQINANWRVCMSEVSGRGVVAIRDIQPNELIFQESPLLIGPTARKRSPLNTCTICYKLLNEVNFICKKGCTLPVCDDCSESKQHEDECDLYRSWKPKNSNEVNATTLRLLTIARGLFLNKQQKDLIYSLQANIDMTYRKEITNAIEFFDNFPKDKNVLQYFYRIVAVLNTNAFEALCNSNNDEILLRGLYPLSGIMNHECTPNTCHYFIKNNIIVVKATRLIPKGSELTTTYTKILWSNAMRQIFLKITKQFTCNCSRCNDPTENGSHLAALRCRTTDCPGVVLPTDCISPTPIWQCIKCASTFEHSKMSKYQEFALNAINLKLTCPSIKEIIEFIDEKSWKICPSFNYVLIEAKLNVIWKMKNSKEVFSVKEHESRLHYCKEILEILLKLNAGECTLKRLISEEIEENQICP